MNLQIVEPHETPIKVQDALTGQWLTVSKRGYPVYADLDGKPFQSYYSEKSAQFLLGQITEAEFYGYDNE